MGCAQSKIENEEAVARCKERKQFMKEAVTARNAFAAAHSAYAMALKNTGAALSDYSHGEFLVSGNHSSSSGAAAVASSSSLPSDLVPPSSAAISNNAASSSSVAIPQPIPDTLPPPPPPLPDTIPSSPPPLQRAATMPEMMKGRSGGGGGNSGNGLNGTIIEEDGTLDDDDDDDDSDMENRERLIRKSRSRGGSNREARKVIEDHHLEEKAPPPPPANPADTRPIPAPRQHHQQQQQQPFYDYFFPNVESMPGTTLEDTPQAQPQPQPSKHVSPRPHSPVTEDEEEDDDDEEDGEEEEEEEEEEETVIERKPLVEERPKRVEEVSVDLEKASNYRGMQNNKGTRIAGERRGGRISVANLANVFNEIDDSFLKASESAHEVSKMLEATRLHYHSNFADNRGI